MRAHSFALCLALAGCGPSQARVTSLEGRLAAMRSQNAQALDQIDRLQSQLAMMESRLRPRAALAQRGADVEAPTPRLKIVKLRAPSDDERWDEDYDEPKGPRAQIKIYETPSSPPVPVPLPVRTAGNSPTRWENSGYPDPSTVNETIPVPSAKPAPIPAEPAPAEPPADDRATALFQRAYTAFTRLNYPDAESGFRTFVSRYPGHASADAATYWLGETLYARGAFEDALRQFREVNARFSKSSKAPYALLKTGYCYAALKDADRARALLAEVVRRYPRTEAAKLATVRLSELLKGQS